MSRCIPKAAIGKRNTLGCDLVIFHKLGRFGPGSVFRWETSKKNQGGAGNGDCVGGVLPRSSTIVMPQNEANRHHIAGAPIFWMRFKPALIANPVSLFS